MKNILIFGNGYIGQKLQTHLNCEVSNKRILQTQDIIDEINKYKADVIINCIGYTGDGNVDGCDKQVNKTIVLNTFLPILFLEAKYRTGVKLVHISSGCMYEYDYEKDTPIKENKKPDYFKLYYSRSKIYAERVLGNDALIVRIRIPLDDKPNQKNILDKLIKYRKVIDVSNSVTYLPDFVKMVEHLIKKNAKGIYNTVNEGGLRYKDLLDTYNKYAYKPIDYEILPLENLKLNRTNLIMSTKKLQNTGFKVRPINEVLEECVKNYLSQAEQAL